MVRRQNTLDGAHTKFLFNAAIGYSDSTHSCTGRCEPSTRKRIGREDHNRGTAPKTATRV